jgi:hypothetical protein
MRYAYIAYNNNIALSYVAVTYIADKNCLSVQII